MRFPFSVKLIFGMGEVTTPGEQARLLVKLYLASVPEETAPFPRSSPDSDGGCMGMQPMLMPVRRFTCDRPS